MGEYSVQYYQLTLKTVAYTFVTMSLGHGGSGNTPPQSH
jgi:hypothetical protein